MISRGVFLVFATYFYFLLFAQLTFLEFVKLNLGSADLQFVMASMGITGFVFSLLTIRLLEKYSAKSLIQVGFVLSAVAALVSPALNSLLSFLFAASFIGASVAVLTVSLATTLNNFFPPGQLGLWAGFGTGLAYFACNVPAVFNADVSTRAYIVTIACMLAAVSFLLRSEMKMEGNQDKNFICCYAWFFIFAFLALVCFDSAAFYIIQQTEDLKALTWRGNARLWLNSVVHLLFAIISGWLIDKKYLPGVLVSASILLVLGVLFLSGSHSSFSAPLYCAGASLYSTALLVFPSLVASKRKKAFWAGLLYAVAGWFGSAIGIGVAQGLQNLLTFLHKNAIFYG